MDQAPSGETDDGDRNQVCDQVFHPERDQPLDQVREGNSTEAVPPAVREYRRACERFGVVPCSPLLRALTSSTVSMNHRGLGPQETWALSVALVADQQVRHLQLRDNWLTGEAARHLADMLTKNCCIEVLDLADNRLEAAGAEAMAQMLGDTTSLRVINLSGNHFTDNDAKCFCDAMSSNYSVKELDLSHNEFSELGGKHLGQLLARNETLEELDLSWNHLRLKGAVALCSGLRVNYALTRLNLSVNGFGNEGALAMAETLKFNGALLHLDLRNNRVGNAGVEALARGLLANDSLRVLQLCFNAFTVDGALVLIRSVKANERSALERLEMSTVRVNQAFLQAVLAIRRTQPLAVLHSGVGGPLARKPKPRTDPMKIIQDYLVEHKLRLWDFFRSADKEGTMKISSDDFRRAVQHLSIPLDKHQLNELMLKLEKDKDGRIDYRSLVDTRKKLVRETRSLIRKEEWRQRNEQQRADRVLHTFRTGVGVLTPVGSAVTGSDWSRSQHGRGDTASRRSTPDGKLFRAASGVSAKSFPAGATGGADVDREQAPAAVEDKLPSAEKELGQRATLPARPATTARETAGRVEGSVPRHSSRSAVGRQVTSARSDAAGTATPQSARRSSSTSARSVTFSDATATSERPGSRCSCSWPPLGPATPPPPPPSAKAVAARPPRAPARSRASGRNPQ